MIPRRALRLSMLVIAIAAMAVAARAEVVIIVSPQSPQALPVEQVCQVFLGKLKTPRPISLVEPPATRDEFYSKLCNRDPAQVRAIWGKLIFTGSGTPPREVASADEMKKAVAADSGSVGYIDRKDADTSVKVIAPTCAACADLNVRQPSASPNKTAPGPRPPAEDGDARSDVVIIVSAQSRQSPPVELVCQVFLGKLKTPKPISLVEPPATRDEFYSKLCKRDPAQVRAIWGKLIFTGSGTPPREVASAVEMRKAIAADPDSVGYIDRKDVDPSVKVIGSAH